LAATGNEIGRQGTVQEHHEGEECFIVGDSIIKNVGTGQNNIIVEWFPGIRREQLHRFLDNKDLGTPYTVVIHVGTNDLKRSVNLDYVMGELYSLVNKAKVKLSQSKIVLNGVLRRTDVAWRHIGALNDGYDWIAKTLGITFVDPNSWLEDWDFAKDGLHINYIGARRISQLYSGVSGLGGRGKKRDLHLMLNVSNEGASERTWETSTQENSTLTWKTTERVEGTMDPEMRESEVMSSEECVVTAESQQIEGKPLVLLQANCRSILNEILEFWNLVDTYNPDVIIGTES
jgi:hypothetical protein